MKRLWRFESIQDGEQFGALLTTLGFPYKVKESDRVSKTVWTYNVTVEFDDSRETVGDIVYVRQMIRTKQWGGKIWEEGIR